jgi:hypothetical protein
MFMISRLNMMRNWSVLDAAYMSTDSMVIIISTLLVLGRLVIVLRTDSAHANSYLPNAQKRTIFLWLLFIAC